MLSVFNTGSAVARVDSKLARRILDREAFPVVELFRLMLPIDDELATASSVLSAIVSTAEAFRLTPAVVGVEDASRSQSSASCARSWSLFSLPRDRNRDDFSEDRDEIFEGCGSWTLLPATSVEFGDVLLLSVEATSLPISCWSNLIGRASGDIASSFSSFSSCLRSVFRCAHFSASPLSAADPSSDFSAPPPDAPAAPAAVNGLTVDADPALLSPQSSSSASSG